MPNHHFTLEEKSKEEQILEKHQKSITNIGYSYLLEENPVRLKGPGNDVKVQKMQEQGVGKFIGMEESQSFSVSGSSHKKSQDEKAEANKDFEEEVENHNITLNTNSDAENLYGVYSDRALLSDEPST